VAERFYRDKTSLGVDVCRSWYISLLMLDRSIAKRKIMDPKVVLSATKSFANLSE
jgi:hypothetical protein